jgi:hypothetical protein
MCFFLFDLATNSHLYMTNSIKWEEDCEYRFSSVVYGRGRDLFSYFVPQRTWCNWEKTLKSSVRPVSGSSIEPEIMKMLDRGGNRDFRLPPRWSAWPLKMGHMVCLETSGNNYQSTLLHIPKSEGFRGANQYKIIQGYYKINGHFQRYVISKPLV